jgi:hypothetical protein
LLFQIGRVWFSKLQDAVASKDTDKILSMFLPDSYWRDLHSLSWDNRTLHRIPTIKAFLDENDRFQSAGFTGLKLEGTPTFVQANEGIPPVFIFSCRDRINVNVLLDFAWIQCFFSFETTLARGRGFFRLMQDPNGSWNAKSVSAAIDFLGKLT